MSLTRFFWNDEGGTVLAETAVMFPVLLLSALQAGQFAHIWYARQMVSYAAYCGARQNIVQQTGTAEKAETAAEKVCSLISLTAASDSTGTLTDLPWLGKIDGSQDVADKVSVTSCSETNQRCQVTVEMQFPLIFPVVNQVMSGLMVLFSDEGGLPRFSPKAGTINDGFKSRDKDIFPHIVLTETAVLPKPSYTATAGT